MGIGIGLRNSLFLLTPRLFVEVLGANITNYIFQFPFVKTLILCDEIGEAAGMNAPKNHNSPVCEGGTNLTLKARQGCHSDPGGWTA